MRSLTKVSKIKFKNKKNTRLTSQETSTFAIWWSQFGEICSIIWSQSKGGKTTSCVTIGYAKTKLKFTAIVGKDPMDSLNVESSFLPDLHTLQSQHKVVFSRVHL